MAYKHFPNMCSVLVPNLPLGLTTANSSIQKERQTYESNMKDKTSMFLPTEI